MQPQRILLCLGSNSDSEAHIEAARTLLQQSLPDLRFTRNLWTEAIGVVSPPYLNCLGYGTTTMDYRELQGLTKAVEHRLGRRPEHKADHLVIVDIDILRLGDETYHPADWDRNFVRQLLAEVHP